jgi:hypothetical protein
MAGGSPVEPHPTPYRVKPVCHGPMTPRATPLAEAVDSLGHAAAAMVRRLGLVGVPPWSIITMVSHGNLIGRIQDG